VQVKAGQKIVPATGGMVLGEKFGSQTRKHGSPVGLWSADSSVARCQTRYRFPRPESGANRNRRARWMGIESPNQGNAGFSKLIDRRSSVKSACPLVSSFGEESPTDQGLGRPLLTEFRSVRLWRACPFRRNVTTTIPTVKSDQRPQPASRLPRTVLPPYPPSASFCVVVSPAFQTLGHRGHDLAFAMRFSDGHRFSSFSSSPVTVHRLKTNRSD